MAQPRDDRAIRAPEKAGEDRRVDCSVQLQQLVLSDGPRLTGSRRHHSRRRGERELARTAPDSFRRTPEHSGGVFKRADLQKAREARVLLARPAPSIRSQPELSRACRDRRGAALGQRGSDLLATKTVAVAIADARVLGRRPSSPGRRMMESEPPSMESQGIGASSQLSRQRLDVRAGRPPRAKHGVVIGAIATRRWSTEPELPAPDAHAFHGTLKASCHGRGRQALLGCDTEKRLLQFRPRP